MSCLLFLTEYCEAPSLEFIITAKSDDLPKAYFNKFSLFVAVAYSRLSIRYQVDAGVIFNDVILENHNPMESRKNKTTTVAGKNSGAENVSGKPAGAKSKKELQGRRKNKGIIQYPKNPGHHGTDNELDLNPEE